MSAATISNASAAEHNTTVARLWIDAFNARDDDAEAAAWTADYIAHAPDSIHSAALDSGAWAEFLGVFREGFPDLHLEVLDSWLRKAAAQSPVIGQRSKSRYKPPIPPAITASVPTAALASSR